MVSMLVNYSLDVLFMLMTLLSASCYGLRKLVDACTHCGTKWDIKFNPLKSL